MRAFLLACFLGIVCAAEPAVAVAGPSAGVTVTLPPTALAAAAALRITGTVQGGDGFLQAAFTTADDRCYSWSEQQRHRAGQTLLVEVPLTAAKWSGPNLLDRDALAVVRSLRLAATGGATQLDLRVEFVPANDAVAPELVEDLGIVDVGAWSERRFRMVPSPGEHARVEVELAGRTVPAFLDQPGIIRPAGWRPDGPVRWVVRGRPGEPLAAQLTVVVDGRRFVLPAASAHVVEAPRSLGVSRLPPQPMEPGQATAWLMPEADGWLRGPRFALAPALAPVLAGPLGWNGCRGGTSTAWPLALSADRAFSAGCPEIDLLPQSLVEEQGPFRFGQRPWHHSQGGSWTRPEDFWRDAPALDALERHARLVVARARAAPGLLRWRMSLDLPADDADSGRSLAALADRLRRMVQDHDGRPLIAAHPQLVRFARLERSGAWFDFADGPGKWRLGPLPWMGTPQTAPREGGGKALVLPLSIAGPVRAVGAQVPVDANLFNLDRLCFRSAVSGGGTARWFVFITDDEHRWYQQRLRAMPGDGAWRTVWADASADGVWEPVGHQQPWTVDRKRRIRSLGLMVFVHDGDPAAAAPTARIADVRRFGWAAEPAQPLTITESSASGATSPRWQPLAIDAGVSVPALNPYDPDSADVVGEAVDATGRTVVHPAYWDEPFRFEMTGGTELAVSSGSGSWRWRWLPDQPGRWKFRLVAKIKSRDAWLASEGPWHETVVDTTGGILPVRRSADPRWLELADGRPYLPIGINLRSPGDTRQQDALNQQRADPPKPRPGMPAPIFDNAAFEALGTRAYERWLPLMQANGMNFARVWMCPWWCGLEWRRDWGRFAGLTVYNQVSAAQLDRVCDLADANGIYLQVELQNHGMFGKWADSQWKDSPYNRSNGGPCATPGEFFSNEEVWKIHEKRLRYTMARWGWRTGICAWSLTSEIEFTGAFDEDTGRNDRGESPRTRRWIERSLRWLAEHDPGRLVTFHTSHPWTGLDMWRGIEGLAFSYSNAYTGFQDFADDLGHPDKSGRGKGRDLALALQRYFAIYDPVQMKRPVLIGEWGGHWADNSPENLACELHHGLWMQAVLPYGGNTGFWWWLWLDASQRWDEYARVARFSAGFDGRGRDFQVRRFRVSGGHGAAEVAGMSDRVGGAGAVDAAPSTPDPGTSRAPADQASASISELRLFAWLSGSDQRRVRNTKDAGTVQLKGLLPDSRWNVVRWDTATGKPLPTQVLNTDDQGRLDLPLGVLAPDAAFVLTRIAPNR